MKKKIKIKHPGSLKKYGYDPDYPAAKRHKALRKLLKKYGYKKLIQKLNAVRVLTKNSNPKYSRIYKRDMEYVRKIAQKNYKKTKRKKKSRRRASFRWI